MKNKKIICIVGPTASGKTPLAVKLAKKFNGEIISADSRQVFRQLDIGTNKEGTPKARQLKVKSPPAARLSSPKSGEAGEKLKEIARNIRWIEDIPQWMIDICEPEEKFTLFDWLKLARKVIKDIFERGKTPIVVGGTGLYIQALAEGFELEQIKNSKFKIKRFSRQGLEKKSLKELQIICRERKIDTSQIDTNNPRRVIRAIEKEQEGIRPKKIKPNFEILQIGITLPRPVLYEQIDKKVDEWFEQGLTKEVKGLLGSGVDPEWLKSIGLNYRLVAEHVLKKQLSTIDELKQIIKFKTHAYARRQLTWFRRFAEIKWAKDYTQAEKFTKNFLG